MTENDLTKSDCRARAVGLLLAVDQGGLRLEQSVAIIAAAHVWATLALSAPFEGFE